MDNMLELLLAGGGYHPRHAPVSATRLAEQTRIWTRNCVPSLTLTPCIWSHGDGPAGIVMSDGRFAACNLDRNGLRPARYVITKDKLITCASEVGIWDSSLTKWSKRPRRARRTDGDRHSQWAYSALGRNR
ncbi:hypothetical protein ACULNC_15990 [Shigella flexneri]